MVLLSTQDKQCLFGAAGQRASAAPKTTKKLSSKFSKAFKKENLEGLLFAAGLPTETPKPESKKTAKITKKKQETTSVETFFKETNKIGLIALSVGTLSNHAINTTHKFVAAVKGDEDKFRLYSEQAKSYLKPHFSLPSQ